MWPVTTPTAVNWLCGCVSLKLGSLPLGVSCRRPASLALTSRGSVSAPSREGIPQTDYFRPGRVDPPGA